MELELVTVGSFSAVGQCIPSSTRSSTTAAKLLGAPFFCLAWREDELSWRSYVFGVPLPRMLEPLSAEPLAASR